MEIKHLVTNPVSQTQLDALIGKGYRRLDEYMFDPGDDVEKMLERLPRVLLIGPFQGNEIIKFIHVASRTYQFRCGQVTTPTLAVYISELRWPTAVIDMSKEPCVFLTNEPVDPDPRSLLDLTKAAIEHVNTMTGVSSLSRGGGYLVTRLAAVGCGELDQVHDDWLRRRDPAPYLRHYKAESIEAGCATVKGATKEYRDRIENGNNVPVETRLAAAMIRWKCMRNSRLVDIREMEFHKKKLQETGWL